MTAQVTASLIASPGSATVTVTNSGITSNSVLFEITAATAPITLACPANSGVAGIAYSSSLTASGGVPPYTFSIGTGALPAGLALTGSTGAIAGTPAAAGDASFVANAVDSLIRGAGESPDSTSTTCNISITAVPTPVVASLSPLAVVAGSDAFTLSVNGSGFTTNSVVQWNGASLKTTFVSAAQLTVPVPFSLVASPESATVTVTANGLTSSGATFYVEEIWTPISDLNAVKFGQLDPATEHGIVSDWNTGVAMVDYVELAKLGITGGYIQVLQFDPTNPDDEGTWVVQNFPIGNSQFLDGGSTTFALWPRATGPVNQVLAGVGHTKGPIPAQGGVLPPAVLNLLKNLVNAPALGLIIGGNSAQTFPVPPGLKWSKIVTDPNAANYNTDLAGPAAPQTNGGKPNLPANFNSMPQFINECASASVANSLDYLNQYTNAKGSGLQPVDDGASSAASGADPKSRLGLLDPLVGNTIIGADPNNNKNPIYKGTASLNLLTGKNAYISNRNLLTGKAQIPQNPKGKALPITMESQGLFCGTSMLCPAGSMAGQCTVNGKLQSCPLPTPSHITQALDNQADVEICLAWPSVGTKPAGAHCVFVTGYKYVNGDLKLTIVHDPAQGTAGMGPAGKPELGVGGKVAHPDFTVQYDNSNPPRLWIVDFPSAALKSMITQVIAETPMKAN